jgi:hypothetical protein
MTSWNSSDTKPIDNEYKIVIVNQNFSFEGYKTVSKDVRLAKWNGRIWEIKDAGNSHQLTVLFWISIPEFEATL